MSAATSALNVGIAADPVVGPAHTTFSDCVASAKVKDGVVVGVATDELIIEPTLPALKLVTVPVASAAILPAVTEKFAPARSIGMTSPACAGLPLVNAEIFVFAILSP
jgi:hypothetical protein